MAAYLYNPYPAPMFDENGNVAPGALAYFYRASTTTPLTTYKEATLSVPHAHPVVANANGVFPPIYLPYVDYRVSVRTASGYPIFDADNIANVDPASDGGGGGGGGSGLITTDQVFQTGMTLWMMFAGPLPGWIRLNGRSIGRASSSATEYANDAAENLFAFCWNNYDNPLAPVAGGRGSSAAADWAANKTIVPPPMRGLVAVGTDNMGNSSPALEIQVTGTCSVTNNSDTITVSSAAGLGIGMWVIINSIARGRIESITGTTVVLNTLFTGATATGQAFRASYFQDAQDIGGKSGLATIIQRTEEMPNHNHAVTWNKDMWTVETSTLGTGSTGTLLRSRTAAELQSANTVELASAGSSRPMNNLQPGRLGVWFMKL